MLLKDFNVEFVGDGDKVFTSSPSSGMKVKMGSIIKVLLILISIKYISRIHFILYIPEFFC